MSACKRIKIRNIDLVPWELQWYQLSDVPPRGLFNEYLQLVIQVSRSTRAGLQS